MRTLFLMIGEFINHIISNLITAIIMAAVSLALIVFFSIYYYQMSRYAPFKNMNIEKGVYVAAYGNKLDLSKCNEVDEVFYTYKTDACIDGDFNNKIMAYDSWCLDYWKCSVQSGKWFSKNIIHKFLNNNEIPIVVGGGKKGLAVGDVVLIETCNVANDISTSCSLKCKVIGIINDDAGIIGDDSKYYAGDKSYESLYHTPREVVNDIVNEDGSVNTGMLVIIPNEILKKANIVLPKTNVYFVKLKDELKDEEVDSIYNYILKNINGCGATVDIFYRESNKKINQIYMTYIPYIVIGITIMMVSIYALSGLIVVKCSKHLAVYSIVGASRKRNYCILLGNSLGTMVISLLLFIILVSFVESYVIEHQIAFVLVNNYIIIAAVSYLFFGLYMSLEIYLEFRKKTTRGMLMSLHK